MGPLDDTAAHADPGLQIKVTNVLRHLIFLLTLVPAKYIHLVDELLLFPVNTPGPLYLHDFEHDDSSGLRHLVHFSEVIHGQSQL